MRKLINIVFIFSFLGSVSQSFNTAFHRYDDAGFYITSINNRCYFSSESYSNWFIDTAFVYSVNSGAQINWIKPIYKYEYNHIDRLIRTQEKCLVIVGHATGCDFLDSSQKTFIMKLDTLGNTIFDNTFTNVYNSWQLDYLKDVTQIPDGSFYCVTDSVLFHFSANGNLIKRKNTGLTGLHALMSLGAGKLLLSGKIGGVNKNIVMDTSGIVLNNSNSFGPVVKYWRLSSGNIISLDGNLKKLSPNLITLDSLAASQGVAH